MNELTVTRGWPLPLGCSVRGDGLRFSVFSRHATALWLVLFDDARDGTPSAEIAFDEEVHRLGDVWTMEVRGLGEGQIYALRADGPWEPERGLRFDADLLLIDPCARAVTGGSAWAIPGLLPGGRLPGTLSPRDRERLWAAMPKCVATGHEFDWGGDRPIQRPLQDSLIYEMHVRGLTAHPSSGVSHPGTYRGVVETIPYLLDLGITAVELLPVQEFDERENPRVNPLTGARLSNYWGYSPVAFFAPEGRYSHLGDLGGQVVAFKEMVRALHEAGIEVILDVVFNHTAEGDERGPTISLRGLDNPIYYLLGDGGARYLNFTGCGNTVNCNHPLVRGLIIDCLRHWVMEMHVDGFRFDLASVLGRDARGRMLANPPLIEAIAEDPLLRGTKLIAEAWDAGGAYQVGSFPGKGWAEWNGRYRDDVRRFWRGDAAMIGTMATRLAGSADLYEPSGRRPYHSVNFITAHDGFTLADLVSYERRHNEANGEGNRDGNPREYSLNFGCEGPTDDPDIRRLRARQARNLLATLLVSQGVPMLLGGDEFGRTQGGNNNAYCHDDETSWFDWSLVEEHADLVRFCRELIARRRRHAALRRGAFFTGATGPTGAPDVRWIGPDGGEVAWDDPAARTLGCVIAPAVVDEPPYLIALHAGIEPCSFAVPPAPGAWRWGRFVDTGREPPDDARSSGDEEPVAGGETLRMAPRSAVILHGIGRTT